MKENDVEVILQRAREKFAPVNPSVISYNGPMFIAKDFKEFIRVSGMSHVMASLYYPQSNGKLERWHRSLKSECVRPKTPLCLEEAQRTVNNYVNYYNEVRLHSAIGYIAPKDMLEGRSKKIADERKEKLKEAKQRRISSRGDFQNKDFQKVS